MRVPIQSLQGEAKIRCAPIFGTELKALGVRLLLYPRKRGQALQASLRAAGNVCERHRANPHFTNLNTVSSLASCYMHQTIVGKE
jgi:hypothetical protein